MMTELDLRDRMSALRALEPTAAEVQTLREAQLKGGPDRLSRRRLLYSGGAAVAAATAMVAVIALLPTGGETPVLRPLPNPLETAAAAAVIRAVPDGFGGYRYVRLRQTIHAPYFGERGGQARYAEEYLTEQWVDANWRGRVRTIRHTILEAAPADPASAADRAVAAKLMSEPDRPRGVSAYRYGDGPFATIDLEDLPRNPAALLAELRAAVADGRWAENPEQYNRIEWSDVQRQFWLGDYLVHLLVEANATPELRSATFGALARMEQVTATSEGDAAVADLRADAMRIRLRFDPDTSDVLGWSVENRPEEEAVRRDYVVEETRHVNRISR